MAIDGNAKITWRFMLFFVALVVGYFVASMNHLLDENIIRGGFTVLFVGLMVATFKKKKE